MGSEGRQGREREGEGKEGAHIARQAREAGRQAGGGPTRLTVVQPREEARRGSVILAVVEEGYVTVAPLSLLVARPTSTLTSTVSLILSLTPAVTAAHTGLCYPRIYHGCRIITGGYEGRNNEEGCVRMYDDNG